MILSSLILAGILVVLVGGVLYGLRQVTRTYLRYRGQRLVTCPETQRPAAVHVDAAQAARLALLGEQSIRLDECSRWPQRKNCGQECLSQISADPQGCLVWNMVADWYRGKSCAYCQKPFGEIHWHDHPAALLSPARMAKQWNEIPAEELPELFERYLPVCWNCYIAESFRQQNRDRVLDRRWERGAGNEYIPKEEGSESGKPTTAG